MRSTNSLPQFAHSAVHQSPAVLDSPVVWALGMKGLCAIVHAWRFISPCQALHVASQHSNKPFPCHSQRKRLGNSNHMHCICPCPTHC